MTQAFIVRKVAEVLVVKHMGVQGPPGATQEYSSIYVTPSTMWTVNHNLNKFPIVACRDFSGAEIAGKVDYLTANTLTVTFTAAVAGNVRCL